MGSPVFWLRQSWSCRPALRRLAVHARSDRFSRKHQRSLGRGYMTISFASAIRCSSQNKVGENSHCVAAPDHSGGRHAPSPNPRNGNQSDSQATQKFQMGLKIAEVPPFQIQRGILTASCRISETFERQATSENSTASARFRKRTTSTTFPCPVRSSWRRQGHERVCIGEFRKQLDRNSFGLQEGARAFNAWFTRD